MRFGRTGGGAWAGFRAAGAALALAGAAPAAGQQAARPEADRAGEFEAVQIATTNPQQLLAQWAQPTPGVNLTTTTRMARNQPITTFIVFKGCKADRAGNCKVTAIFEVVGPKGGTYEKPATAEIWVDKPAPPPGVYMLSVSGMGLGVENKDDLGPYRVRTTITDHVAGVSLHTEQTLTAVEN